ncbi:MAG TPA: M13 family metallopeptidase [Terriglobales bacterium]|nr:M13 family metallopeptidase [Terriglobales bacterium]
MHKLVVIIALLAPLACAQTERFAQNGPPPELPPIAHFSPDIADKTLDPCTDFYQYSCSTWSAVNPLPSDEVAWGTAGPVFHWNQAILGQTLEKLSADDSSRAPHEQKIGDFYYSCMDEKTIESHSREWLQAEIDLINRMKSKSDFAAEVAHLHEIVGQAWSPSDNQTNSSLFGFAGQPDYADASHYVAQFDQGGMNLPARSYYLDQDEKAKEIRAKYLAHIAKMFVLIGEKPEQAKADADVVLAIETNLAQVAMDAISRRDPKNLNNKMPLAQIKALTPSFDFDQYLRLVNAPSSAHYIVTSPSFFKGVEGMMQRYSLPQWKTYFRWQVVSGSAPALDDAIVQESFDFFGKTLVGAKEIQPRWRRCVNSTDTYLGEALGQAYVARAFPPENKQRVLALVQDLSTALGKDIDSLDWMSDETKKQAHEKSQATLDKIGYPDHWRDYSPLKIGRDNYLANRQRAIAFEFERWVAKVGQPVDRSEWTMTPPTFNAYEDPPTNTINFPAGMLQPPEFEMSQDDSVNYGAIGAVIGHEIIHGFDDQGRKFDAQGNLRDWWTAKDATAYESRDKCISDQYTEEIPEAGPGVKQDGRMTLGEDTADNGGIYLAMNALQESLGRQGRDMDTKEADGLTPRQRFFLAYGFSWCTEFRPELIRLAALSDPHSYPKYRVNNTLANMPEFATAFGCHKGQREARVNACHVW